MSQAGKPVAGSLSAPVGNMIYFKPVGNLTAGEECIVVAVGIKLLTDEVLPAFSWSFTAGSEEDKTLPKVESVNPDDGSAGVAVDVSVKVIFSEDVIITSATTITLWDNVAGASVPFVFKADSRSVNLLPSGLLKNYNGYKVTISGLTDSAGNQMEPLTLTFTTTVGTFTLTFPVSQGISYSLGGTAQATLDKSTGLVTVNNASNAWDVSLRWTPVMVEKGQDLPSKFPLHIVAAE